VQHRSAHFAAVLDANRASRANLQELHRSARIHDSVLHVLEAELDLEDLSVRKAMFAGIEYAPRVPIQLAVLAVAQMGVHLIFFLYISSAPGQANNSLALAFGIFVVGPHRFGSMIIMANLNHATVPMDRRMQMQR
jgi:heme/copper-type cytochrome/quinol oxidase subunit 4